MNSVIRKIIASKEIEDLDSIQDPREKVNRLAEYWNRGGLWFTEEASTIVPPGRSHLFSDFNIAPNTFLLFTEDGSIHFITMTDDRLSCSTPAPWPWDLRENPLPHWDQIYVRWVKHRFRGFEVVIVYRPEQAELVHLQQEGKVIREPVSEIQQGDLPPQPEGANGAWPFLMIPVIGGNGWLIHWSEPFLDQPRGTLCYVSDDGDDREEKILGLNEKDKILAAAMDDEKNRLVGVTSGFRLVSWDMGKPDQVDREYGVRLPIWPTAVAVLSEPNGAESGKPEHTILAAGQCGFLGLINYGYDEKNKNWEHQFFMPATILQLLPLPGTSHHLLLLRNDGLLQKVKYLGRKYNEKTVPGEFETWAPALFGSDPDPVDWLEQNVPSAARSFNPQPFFHLLWRKVVEEMAPNYKGSTRRDAWRDIVDWLVDENNSTEMPDVRCKWRRRLLDALLDVERWHRPGLLGDDDVKQEIVELVRESLEKLTMPCDEAVLSLLYQQGGFLDSALGTSLARYRNSNACQEQSDLIRRNLSKLQGVEAQGVYRADHTVREVIPFYKTDGRLAVVSTNNTVYCLEYDKRENSCREVGCFDWRKVGIHTRLRLMLPMARDAWLLVSRTGETVLVKWNGQEEEKPESRACPQLDDLRCYCGNIYSTNEGDMVVVSGVTTRRELAVHWIGKGDLLFSSKAGWEKVALDTGKGRGVDMAATDHYLYLVDEEQGILHRTPLHHGKLGYFIPWIKTRRPNSLRQVVTVFNARGNGNGEWLVITGDNQGRVLAFREIGGGGKRDVSKAVLAWSYRCPSGILRLGVLKKDSRTLLAASTARDGLFLIDQEDGAASTVLRHIFPAYAQAVTRDAKTVFTASLQGKVWRVSLGNRNHQDVLPDLKPGSFLEDSDFFCRQYRVGRIFSAAFHGQRVPSDLVDYFEKAKTICSRGPEAQEQLHTILGSTAPRITEGRPQSVSELHTILGSTPPLAAYTARLLISCLLNLEQLETVCNEEELNQNMQWLAGLQMEVQTGAARRLLQDMAEIDDWDPDRLGRVDRGLAEWARQLDERVGSVLHSSGHADVLQAFYLVMAPLLSAMLRIALRLENSQCGKLLGQWLTTRETLGSPGPPLASQPEFPSLVFSRLVREAPALDSMRLMAFCWEKFVLLHGGSASDALGQWNSVKEANRQIGYCDAYWPECCWQLPSLMHGSGDVLKSETLARWYNELRDTGGWQPDLKSWLDDIRAIKRLFTFPDVWENRQTHFDRPPEDDRPRLARSLVTWLAELEQRILEFFSIYTSEYDSVVQKKIKLDAILTHLRQPPADALSLTEQRLTDLLRSSWRRRQEKLERQWKQDLLSLVKNDPAQVVQGRIFEEKWDNVDSGTLTIELANCWAWELEFKDGSAWIPLPPSGEPISYDRKIVRSFQRAELHGEDKTLFPLDLPIRFSGGDHLIRFDFGLELPLKITPETWLVEQQIAEDIAGHFLKAYHQGRPVLIQSLGDKVRDRPVERLIESLEKRGYQQVRDAPKNDKKVYWIKPGSPITADLALACHEKTAWVPLDLEPPLDFDNSQIRACFHGINAPSFSPLACHLALQLVDSEFREQFKELERLLPEKIKESTDNMFDAMPEVVANWIDQHARDLLQDAGWLFGVETDLKPGHLCDRRIWHEWLNNKQVPGAASLDERESGAILGKLKRYWPNLQTMPGAGAILKIFRELLGFEAETGPVRLKKLPAWQVFTGGLTIARRHWKVGLVLAKDGGLEKESDKLESALLGYKRREKRLWILITPDQSGSRRPRPALDQLGFWVDLGPEDLLGLLLWPRPQRLMGWRMSRRLTPAALDPYQTVMGLGNRVSTMFHGRKQELQQLERDVLNNRKSYLVHGARRIGKTSLLEILRYDWGNMPGCKVVYLDFQSVHPGMPESAEEIFREELGKALRKIPFRDLDQVEQYFRTHRLPHIFLMDEADRLFAHDRRIDDTDAGYSGGQYRKLLQSFPLFQWLRDKTRSENPVFTVVMVSYSYGSGMDDSLAQWIMRSGTPLYNWVEPLALKTWTEDESESFLRGTLEDLGIFLRQDLLGMLVDYSMNLPWILQTFGKSLIKAIGVEPAAMRLPSGVQVRRTIVETLGQLEAELIETIRTAVDLAGVAYRKDQEKKRSALARFKPLFLEFAGRRRFLDDPGEIFSLQDVTDHFKKDETGKGIGSDGLEWILSHLTRTLVINGMGEKKYQFAYGLLPRVGQALKRLRDINRREPSGRLS